MSGKNHLANLVLLGYASVKKLVDAAIDKTKLILFYQHFEAIKLFADPDLVAHKPKVLVAIPHITAPVHTPNQAFTATKVERLQRTLDGLLTSFAYCQLEILVFTVPERHIISRLPQYLQACLTVQVVTDCDPMFIGFQAQDALASRVQEFDYFLFIEDDIVIADSSFLEKMSTFCQHAPRLDFLLMPNRYEMHEGRKSYIDLTIANDLAWDRVSTFKLGPVQFAECNNPHAGLYCLSQAQMQYWIHSGRQWKNREMLVGPLESAATFCLQECFKLYKPHPKNLNYLEVRHFDTKYSQLLPGPSPYILSAVSDRAVRPTDG